MGNALSRSNSAAALSPDYGVKPQRLAWGVMLLAFAIFCVICVASTIGVNYFMFQSTLPMSSLLLVGRGTVGITEISDPVERVERVQRSISQSTSVGTDSQSQATLSFRDTYRDGALVAAITLKRESELTLRDASRPRFEWSTINYRIDLYNVTGELDIVVAQNLGRNLNMVIRTQQGALIYISESGRYVINVTDDQVQVVNREGMALLKLPNQEQGHDIPIGEQAVAHMAGGDVVLTPSYIDLLQNSTFQETFLPEVVGDDAVREIPTAWGCGNAPNTIPRSYFESQMLDGRATLHLFRGDDATSHGETTCTQPLGTRDQPLDVSGYAYLALRATFRIDFQSLNTCGDRGSECPLMLRLDYMDNEGHLQVWRHGFYARSDAQAEYPIRCDSCTQDHEFINEQAWYTYETGNLYTLFPEVRRPVSIVSLIFYASGHQYNVHVSEMSLLAGQLAPAPEVPDAMAEATQNPA
ncbi:MAG: hypothetical protein H7175_21165 [Burkholderiales bacterium]|nr:hypothetical protein [Anaerolineae bacterium]